MTWALLVLAGLLLGGACAPAQRTAPMERPDSLETALQLKRAQRLDEAATELKRVSQSASPHLRAQAQWELASVLRDQGNLVGALSTLAQCATGNPPPWILAQLPGRLRTLVEEALSAGIPWDQVEGPLRNVPADLRLEAIEGLLGARRCFEAMALMPPGTHVSAARQAQHRDLQRRISRCVEEARQVLGVVVPLSGEYGAFGENLLRGVMVAVQDTSRLALRIVDSQSDPVTCVLAVDELGAQSEVIAIIAPVQSRAATGAALAAAHHRVPLLVPASSPGGLARIGPWVFQSSPALQEEARAVAKYAMIQRGLTRFGVCYPAHASGERAMEAFRDQVVKLGGEVVAVERYVEGRDTNFRSQIVNIRTAGPQALFIPGEPRDIVQLARQLAFYGVKCQLLGTSAWGDAEVAREGGNAVEGALFADLAVATKLGDQDVFHAQFVARFGADPDHYARLGYDLARVVWDEVVRGVPSREELRRRLSRRDPFQGVSGIINWKGEQTGGAVQLYVLTGGVAVPVTTASP